MAQEGRRLGQARRADVRDLDGQGRRRDPGAGEWRDRRNPREGRADGSGRHVGRPSRNGCERRHCHARGARRRSGRSEHARGRREVCHGRRRGGSQAGVAQPTLRPRHSAPVPIAAHRLRPRSSRQRRLPRRASSHEVLATRAAHGCGARASRSPVCGEAGSPDASRRRTYSNSSSRAGAPARRRESAAERLFTSGRCRSPSRGRATPSSR